MVLASLDTPHSFRNRFEPVWITGRLSARPTTQALDYVDGAAQVQSSYQMDVMAITPYADDPSAQMSAGSFSPDNQGPELRLSRSGLPHPPLSGGSQ